MSILAPTVWSSVPIAGHLIELAFVSLHHLALLHGTHAASRASPAVTPAEIILLSPQSVDFGVTRAAVQNVSRMDERLRATRVAAFLDLSTSCQCRLREERLRRESYLPPSVKVCARDIEAVNV